MDASPSLVEGKALSPKSSESVLIINDWRLNRGEGELCRVQVRTLSLNITSGRIESSVDKNRYISVKHFGKVNY